MWKIPIYEKEMEAGIADQIVKASSVALLSQISPSSEKSIEKIYSSFNKSKASANQGQFDLYYLDTILASVGWNKNTEVFLPEEIFPARHTPEDKPLNLNHDQIVIIGHMTGSEVVDDEMNVINDDTTIDKLPEKFHIKTNAVIYKIWEDADRQEMINTILEEISKGEWFVSMECLFRGFDYALVGQDGIQKVIARNSETAYLSKYLRCYGGVGEYNNCAIGRVLRNITFSGKGLVKKPANPDSVILNVTKGEEKEKIIFEKEHSSEKIVYSNVSSENKEVSDKTIIGDYIMADNVSENTFAKENERLVASVQKLQAELDEMRNNTVKAHEEKYTLVVAENEKLKKDKEDSDKKAMATESELTKAKTENDAMKETLKQYKQKAELAQAGASDSEAETFMKDWASVSDEVFSKALNLAKSSFKKNKSVADSGTLADKNHKPIKTGDPTGDPVAGKNSAQTGGNKVAARKEEDDDDEDDKSSASVLDSAKANSDPDLNGTDFESTKAEFSVFLNNVMQSKKTVKKTK